MWNKQRNRYFRVLLSIFKPFKIPVVWYLINLFIPKAWFGVGPVWREVVEAPSVRGSDVCMCSSSNESLGDNAVSQPELFADAHTLNTTQVSWETSVESWIWCNSQFSTLPQNVPVVPEMCDAFPVVSLLLVIMVFLHHNCCKATTTKRAVLEVCF